LIEFHHKQNEALPDVVVKFSGNSDAFLVLGFNQLLPYAR
jgi:hypothetical protein